MRTYALQTIKTNPDEIFLSAEGLSELIGNAAYCTLAFQTGALQLYDPAEWEALAEWVEALPPQRQRAMRPLYAFASKISVIDDTVSIPRSLVDRFAVEQDVVLCIMESGEKILCSKDRTEYMTGHTGEVL